MVRYRDHTENHFQTTYRTVRKVVKLWGVEDTMESTDLMLTGVLPDMSVAKIFVEQINRSS